MRLRCATDANQADIVAALRAVGCSVQILAAVGKGCPDLLVSRSGVNYLLEVKDGSKPPSERKLTPDQVEWHRGRRGQVCVVTSVNEALRAVGLRVAA
ncbi:MAG TPA: hypothetical protein VMS92_22895 [Mycobacterium sp.]|nr:hypothetical protein [Mycobacterium sp.]